MLVWPPSALVTGEEKKKKSKQSHLDSWFNVLLILWLKQTHAWLAQKLLVRLFSYCSKLLSLIIAGRVMLWRIKCRSESFVWFSHLFLMHTAGAVYLFTQLLAWGWVSSWCFIFSVTHSLNAFSSPGLLRALSRIFASILTKWGV